VIYTRLAPRPWPQLLTILVRILTAMNKINQGSSFESSTVAALDLPLRIPLDISLLSEWIAGPLAVGPDVDGFSATVVIGVEVSGSGGWAAVGGEELMGLLVLEDPNSCAAPQSGSGSSISSTVEVWPLTLVVGTAANCSVPFTGGTTGVRDGT
jgi:hypothetical protein